MRPRGSVSFTDPPTARARLRRAASALWGFGRWLCQGPVGPSLRWMPIALAMLLFLGVPTDRYDQTPALHGDARIVAAVAGLTVIAAHFTFWLIWVRGTGDDAEPRQRKRGHGRRHAS